MYSFYLGGVLLPVAPEELTLKIKIQIKTMTLINEGEINFLRQAGLTDIDFDVMIPAVDYSFARYDGGFKSPTFYINHCEQLKVDKKPFQFIVVRQRPDGQMIFDTNITVSMESYNIKEQAKNGLDLILSVKLKQYKEFRTKVVKAVGSRTASIQPQREQNNSPAPKKETTYTVKKGDCLWNIAKKMYGNGADYKKIASANGGKIKNPNLIYPGQVLTIPKA